MKIAASATIGGKVTNRVHVKRARRKAASTGTAMARFRRDPSVHGLDVVQVCISIPAGELAALDATAERVQMARSHFIRQAVKHFAAKVTP